MVIGAGLGGLTCAAYLARSGLKPQVLEQHTKPGGYATRFQRRDFSFEVSLHALPCGAGNPTRRILDDLGVSGRLDFVKLPELYRVVTPKHDLRFPQADPEAFKAVLADRFPEESRGIGRFVDGLVAVADEIGRLARNQDRYVTLLFPFQYRGMWKVRNRTLGDLLAESVRSPELATLLSILWCYYGLPPSRLSGFYFSAGTGDYIKNGAWYPRGTSQDLSDSLVRFIEGNGGSVHLGERVSTVRVHDRLARSVVTEKGREVDAGLVVSNASAPVTFGRLIADGRAAGRPWRRLDRFGDRLGRLHPSLSSFIVWLGLGRDVTAALRDGETFLLARHDPEADYVACLGSDAATVPLAITVYDNILPGFSPAGKSTMTVMFLCGPSHWKQFEADYAAGRKDAYDAEKSRIARAILGRVEERLIPGLSSMIEVMEAATPLTNARYTGNAGGAIYGFDQVIGNTFISRVDSRTPIRNLYLASAWGSPGGGFAGALRSGLKTSRCILEDWKTGRA